MNFKIPRIILYTIFGVIFWCSSSGVALAEEHTSNEILVRWKGMNQDFSVLTVDNVDDAVASLQTNPLVDHVEPNYSRQVSVFSNDTFVTDQYHLKQDNDADIDAGRAWDITTGSEDVVVAVIDTGVDLDHPDLVDTMWTNVDEIDGNGVDDDGNGYIDDRYGWDFTDDDNDPNPTPVGPSWSDAIVVHGTHVAGLIGAGGNNGIGTSGVNWDVTIMPIRIFTDTGSSSVDDVYNAVNYAVNNGADIINMSYGGGGYSVFEAEAIEAAYDQGVISIAAAGNESTDLNASPTYPACHRYVVGVAATDATDAATSFTNFGTDCVDVAAPGDLILSTLYSNDPTNGFTDEYGYLSGTSMATPIVSGIAALMKAANSSLTPATITSVLIDTTDNLSDPTLGSGRVNAYQALLGVEALGDPAAPKVKAYHSENKKKSIAKNTPSADTTPYFIWKTPESSTDIIGYYLYWGPNKKNPVTYGSFQTDRDFSPVGVTGDNKTYRLRIKAVDNNNAVSDVGTFRYIADSL